MNHIILRMSRKVIEHLASNLLALGLWVVPYLNRHFRRVEVDYQESVSGEKASWAGEKPLVVYFTRVGNTDFEEDVDAVSGASLMLASGKLTGNRINGF